MKRLTAIVLLLLLLTVPTHAATVESVKLPEGAYGVWYIHNIRATATLNTSKARTRAENQKVVDREDAALWWPYRQGHAIIDHLESQAGDGWWRVADIRVGDIGELTTEKGKTYYVCVAVMLAEQVGNSYLSTIDGRLITCHKGDILCVSCADEGGRMVYVAYFKKVN